MRWRRYITDFLRLPEPLQSVQLSSSVLPLSRPLEAGQSEDSGLRGRRGLKRRELKQLVSDRGRAKHRHRRIILNWELCKAALILEISSWKRAERVPVKTFQSSTEDWRVLFLVLLYFRQFSGLVWIMLHMHWMSCLALAGFIIIFGLKLFSISSVNLQNWKMCKKWGKHWRMFV